MIRERTDGVGAIVNGRTANLSPHLVVELIA